MSNNSEHADYDSKRFGETLKKHRLALGWSDKQLALLYSEFVGKEDDPIDPSFIYHLEA